MYSKDILECDRTPEKQNSTGIRKTFLKHEKILEKQKSIHILKT